MKRFEFEDGDEFQDEDLFSETDDDDDDEGIELNSEYIRLLEKKELIEALKITIYQKEINQELLFKTVDFLSKSFFWRFKSNKRKLQLIVETYQTFKTLVDIDSLIVEEPQVVEQKPTEE